MDARPPVDCYLRAVAGAVAEAVAEAVAVAGAGAVAEAVAVAVAVAKAGAGAEAVAVAKAGAVAVAVAVAKAGAGAEAVAVAVKRQNPLHGIKEMIAFLGTRTSPHSSNFVLESGPFLSSPSPFVVPQTRMFFASEIFIQSPSNEILPTYTKPRSRAAMCGPEGSLCEVVADGVNAIFRIVSSICVFIIFVCAFVMDARPPKVL
jgi:hypothetical protein